MKTSFAIAAVAAVALGALTAGGAASAATPSEQLNLCASALAAEAGPGHRARFVKSKGGAVKTVTIKLISADGGEKTGVCKIRGTEVTSASLKS